MTQTFQEKELQFKFPANLDVEELDKQGVRLPAGMSLVDFVVTEDKRIFLIEVKDPSHSRTPEKERKKYLERLKNNSLINNELTPKARDSYTFLHLMEKDSKPFVYVVLFGLDSYEDEAALLLGFKDRLLKRIRYEAKQPWERQYLQDCIVISTKQWNEQFPDWQVSRLSAGGSP